MRKSISIALLFVLLSAAVLAQDETPIRVTNQNRMGELPFSTSIGTDIEHVDLSTGALNVSIPIWSVPGRGMDAKLSFHWNSNFWVAAERTDAFGNPYFIYNEAKDTGWRSNHPYLTFGTITRLCDEGVPAGQPGRSVFWLSYYIYYDEQGGQHQLPLQSGGGACGAGSITAGPDLTAAGIWGVGSGSGTGVTLANGTGVSIVSGVSTNPLLSSLGDYQDANGNFQSSTTDTLGRPLYTAVDAPFDANSRPTQTTFTVKDANGSSQNIVVVWEPLSLTTSFGTSGVREATGLLWYTIQSITLPNGTAYTFHYEPDYGELTEIDLPTGGVIKYTWANYTYPNPTDVPPLQESRRYVTTRTETVNGVTNTWNIQLTSVPSTSEDQSTVTYPPVSTPSESTIQNQSVFLSFLGSLIDAKIYSGPATGTAIREYNMQYQDDDDPTVDSLCDPSDSGPPAGMPMGTRLRRIITIFDNGMATKKEFDYDSLTYTYYPYHCSTLAQSNQPVQFTASRGNVTAIREYGFGTPSGAVTNMDVPNAPLLRTTTRTYWHDSHSQYIAPNIVDKVATETITDNVANAIAAKTQYSYDSTPIQATTNLSSVPGHSSTFTSSFTIRGNPTLVQRWNNADNSLLPTTYTYDDLGNIRSLSDPNGNQTTWIYDDSFDIATNTCPPSSNSYVYVSKKTDGVQHNFYVTRRACTGQVASHQDDNDRANGVATTYSYDEMGRVLTQKLPNGGTVKNDYHNDAVPPLLTTTTAAAPDPDIIQDSHFDGLHRLVQTQLHAPGSNVIVDTTYDAVGRVARVYNPHGSLPAPTDGSTTTVYDALSRPLLVTKQDSSTVGYVYAGNKTTITDESGKQRVSYTDALGRLVEVDEPGDAFAGTQASGSVPVNGPLRSATVGTQAPTQATGNLTITGTEASTVIDPCASQDTGFTIGGGGSSCPKTIYDTGSVTITVNGHSDSAPYGSGSTDATVASGLATAINNDTAAFVTASASPGSTILYLTAKQTGPGGDYSWSLSSTSSDTTGNFGPAGSFSASPASGTMGGGSNGTPGTTVWDAGTVSVSLGSSFTGEPVPYGSTTSIDVRFTNDSCSACSGTAGGGDRNLFINSVTVGSTTILPSDPSVSYVGSPCNATSNGIGVLACNGDLDLTTTATGQSITVSAYGSPDLGIYPTMQLLLNGTMVAQWAVTGTSQNYTVNVPAGETTASLLAVALAATLNVPNSPVTATATSTGISITYKSVGAAGNVAVSVASTPSNPSLFPGGSFSGTTTFINGKDAYSSGIDHPFVTLYHYDMLSNLSCVEQHGDATGTGCPTLPFSPTSPVPPDSTNPWRLRRFGYNSLRELLWASNPESGVITYAYDPDGNVLQKTSPAPNQTGTATTTIAYCYDPDNRLLAKGYSTSPNPPQQCSSTPPYLPNPAVTTTYDVGLNGIGHLTSLTDQAGSVSYTYDVMGRIKTEERTIAGITKSISYGYDLAGFPTQITYPSTRVVNYTADSAGRAVSAIDGNLTGYATAGSYNSAGSLASFASGSSITNSFLYNPRLQLCRITAWTSGSVPGSCSDAAVHGNLMDRGYNFGFGSGDNGNVLGITNYRDTSRSQSFTYDALNRIVTGSTSGNTGALSWGENYSIDAWGNLQISPMAGKAQGGNFQHAGDVNNRASGLGYDAAGNLTNYTALGQYVYDSENRIQSTGGMNYVYDADGNRVEKSNSSTGTLYWYGMPGILAESDLAGNIKSEYVFFNGKRTARVDLPGNTVHYYLSDHLNSASMLVTAAGVPEEESDYSPFGTEYVVTGSGTNHYKFTGKERDTESGLDYFGARYYSNAFGRFITPDWAGSATTIPYADFATPQSLNLYAYVRNAPTTLTDNDGHCTADSEVHGSFWCILHFFGAVQTQKEEAAAAAQRAKAEQDCKARGYPSCRAFFLTLMEGMTIGGVGIGEGELSPGPQIYPEVEFGAFSADEQAIADALAADGDYAVPLAAKQGQKSADALVNGTNVTEFKTVNVAGPNTLKNQIQDAAKQAPNMVIDVRKTSITRAQALSQIARAEGNVGSLKGKVTVLTKEGRLNY